MLLFDFHLSSWSSEPNKGSETCTASATAAASDTITCSQSGVGQYDNNTGVITFNSGGLTWSKNGVASTSGTGGTGGGSANGVTQATAVVAGKIFDTFLINEKLHSYVNNLI